MSVKSKPGTSSQAEGSNISETTNREDTSQNRAVIKWLDRVDPSRPFLKTPSGTHRYGEVAHEVRARMSAKLRFVQPRLDASSVFDLLAGMWSGGVVVGGSADAVGSTELAGTALVVFTSGTTGVPKGVRLTGDNLEAAAEASRLHLGHDQDDTWLLAMPLHHVAGLSILVRQAYTGGSVLMLPDFDPSSYAAALKGEVSIASVVPTMLHRLLQHDTGPYHGLRAVMVGGGPIPSGLLERAAQAGLPVLPTYGLTETFGQVATLRPGSPLEYKAHPLPGVELRIDEEGRIAVRSRQVSPGYLGEPDRTSSWLVTNDLGQIDDDGAVRGRGRADSVIVTGGEKVDPHRVEAEVAQYEAAGEVLVVGVPDPEWGSLVTCLYTGDASPDQLDSWAHTRLPGYMVPKRWIRVDALPDRFRASNGAYSALFMRENG